MTKGRMYRGFSDPATARERRRQQRRTNEGKRVAVMCALTAITLVGFVITSGLAITYTPELRAPIYELRCLGWDVTTPESFPLQMLYTDDAYTRHLSLYLT